MEEMKKSIDTNGDYLWEEQGGGGDMVSLKCFVAIQILKEKTTLIFVSISNRDRKLLLNVDI